jgi:heat shock protein HslJ
MSTHPRPAPAGLVLLSLVLAGCGKESVQGTDEPTNDLAGEYVGDGPARLFPEGSAPIRLTLHDGEISFTAACNHFSGRASWDDGVLRATGMGGTEMGCSGLRQQQDQWMVRFFGSSPRVELDGTDLAVRSGKDRVRFVPDGEMFSEAPGEKADLIGATWWLTGIGEQHGDSIGMTVIPGGDGRHGLVYHR